MQHQTLPATPTPLVYGRGVSMNRVEYQKYLKSKQWHALRVAMFERYPMCSRCGLAPSGVVRHVCFDQVGHETLADLEAVCRECYRELRRRPRPRRRRRSKPYQRERAALLRRAERRAKLQAHREKVTAFWKSSHAKT